MAQGTAEVKGEDPGKLGLAEDLPYSLTWDLQDPYAAKLEITLSVDGAEPPYIDRVDPSSSRAREAFIAAVIEKMPGLVGQKPGTEDAATRIEECRARLDERMIAIACERARAREALRKDAGASAGQGSKVELRVDKPWPDDVQIAVLLDRVADFIRGHVVLPSDREVHAVALWIVASYMFNAARVFPRLHIHSPEKECGKTILLEVIEALVQKPLLVTGVSGAAIYRMTEVYSPTWLVDEADSIRPEYEDIRQVINSGHRKGGRAIKCVGDTHEPRAFNSFSPMALASIRALWDTVESRSIIIRMDRKERGITVKSMLGREPEETASSIRRQILRWAQEHESSLETLLEDETRLPLPAGLGDRAKNNWAPLLAVALLAGQEWTHRAIEAAEAIDLSPEGREESVRFVLLRDIRAIFQERGLTIIASTALTDALCSMEESPWATWSNGRPITPNRVARFLSDFNVRSGNARIDGGVAKCYTLGQFQPVFSRYLSPQHPPVEPLHRYTPTPSRDSDHPDPLQGQASEPLHRYTPTPARDSGNPEPLHGLQPAPSVADSGLRCATGGRGVAGRNGRQSNSHKRCSGVAVPQGDAPGNPSENVDPLQYLSDGLEALAMLSPDVPCFLSAWAADWGWCTIEELVRHLEDDPGLLDQTLPRTAGAPLSRDSLAALLARLEAQGRVLVEVEEDGTQAWVALQEVLL